VEIVRHPEETPSHARGCVAALGNFDGFHRGHQAVVGEAGRLARAMRAPLAVITTEPHPRRYFRPDDPPFRLTPFRERAYLLERFGVDVLGALTFDESLAGTPAPDFVLEVLLRGFGALNVVVGFNYRFGKGRGGGVDTLAWMGEMEGFGVSAVPPVYIENGPQAGETYSSSAIREALGDGRAREAGELLGHWWALSGRIVEGDRRGRTIGFPTINLALGETMRPCFGVYAVRVEIEGEAALIDGVANIGRRPTFDKTEALLEVHLFDFAGDLYGRHARVEIVDFLRPEQPFDGLAALKAQICEDCETARIRLADPANARERLLPAALEAYLAKQPAIGETLCPR